MYAERKKSGMVKDPDLAFALALQDAKERIPADFFPLYVEWMEAERAANQPQVPHRPNGSADKAATDAMRAYLRARYGKDSLL